MGFHLTTSRGYDFFEVTSALQKEIRRGNEEAAMYWALELSSKYDDFIWRRLAIIASEDIGPADNSISVLISVLGDNYKRIKKKSSKPTERIILSHAIIAMCKAEKTRAADDLACLISHEIENEGIKREIPDYALDFHTRRGKIAGRGWDHWFDESCKLENEAPCLNHYRDRAMAMRKKHGRLKSRKDEKTNGDSQSLFPEMGV